MSDIRPAGRDITNLRQVRVKETGQIIWADSDTFNGEWHEEIQGIARDEATAKAQEDALRNP